MAAPMNEDENMLESKIVVSSVSGASLIRTKPVFGPNSKCLFCCSESVIKVFSTESGECIRNLEGHTKEVTGIVINPNNKLQILSCSLDQSVIQWDYSDGVLLKVYQLHHPLYYISLLSHREQPSFVLKRQTARQGYDIIECNLSNKKDSLDVEVLLEDVGEQSDSIAVGCKNKVLAYIQNNNLVVWKNKKTKRHSIDRTEFTCVACHPTELCVVTGCKNGRIYYWYDVFSSKHDVVKTYYHWHALPVLDLCFTHEGSYLLSGGHECVLVKWQYNSTEKDFKPRLGAPINHVSCSQDNMYYATCHTDNVIQILTNKFQLKQVYQGLTCGRSFIQRTHPAPAGLHYDPRSRSLVTNGKIGHLQFFSVSHDKHLYNLEIVGQNYISPENLDKPMVATEIIAADFSNHGDWLATVELWDDQVMSTEIRLKFWKFVEKTQQYTLNTTVEMPHSKMVTCVKLRPESGEADDQPMAVTTSTDCYFKTWTLVDDTNIYRKNTKWTCVFSGYYRNQIANTASFAEDGSLLCVGFGSVITIWNPDTNILLQTLVSNNSDIKHIEFGRFNCCHLLVICSEENITTWNLSSCTVVWSVELSPVCLVSDTETDVMAVISKDKSVYYFRPSSPEILYSQSSISPCTVAGALFIPQSSTTQGRQLPTTSKLYYINTDHQLLCLSEVDNTPKQINQITIQENIPQSTLSMILSQDHNKHQNIGTRSTSKDTKSWTTFLDTPPQVQPAVTSLCKQFVQSMLVKSGDESTPSNEDEDDLSDKESSMEEDNNEDSDDEEIIKRKSQQTKIQDKKIKVQDNKSFDMNSAETVTSLDSDFTMDSFNWYQKKLNK